MSSYIDRMVRAARLDPQLYEEVEADQGAMGQAMGVVVLASIAAGVGMGSLGVGQILVTTTGALLGWVIWAALTYVIGVHLLPEPQTEADMPQMLRTIGFASAPGILRVLGVIPGLMWISVRVASVWMLVALVIAVRQALDYKSTGRAVAVCVIGFVVQVVVFGFIAAAIGTASAGT
jgi:hypothetical protein